MIKWTRIFVSRKLILSLPTKEIDDVLGFQWHHFLSLRWWGRWRHYVLGLSVRTSVRANFLCNCPSEWHKLFTIGATTHVGCFNDNYDVIGHLVWQPCCKKRKTLDLCMSESARWKNKKVKPGTWQVLPTPAGNKCNFFLCHQWLPSDIIVAYVKHFIRSVWKTLWVISSSIVRGKIWWRHQSRGSAAILLFSFFF